MNNPVKKLFSKLRSVQSEKLYYSIMETSNILHIPERDIYTLIKQKKILAIQIEKGGNFRISREEVNRLKNNNGRV